MPTYLTPGVYVEEVDSGSKPLAAVGTAVAAFVGFTAKAPPDNPKDLDGLRPRLVTSWTQFEKLYGGFAPGKMLPHSVFGYFNNGGGPCYVTSLHTVAEDWRNNAEKAAREIPADGSNSASAAPAEEGKGEEGKEPAKQPSVAKKDLSFVVEAKVGGIYGNQYEVFIQHEFDEQKKPTGTFIMRVRFPGVVGTVVEERSGLKAEKGQITENGLEVSFESVNITHVSGKMPAETPHDPKNNPAPYKLLHSQTGKVKIDPLPQDDIIGDSAARTGLGGLEALDDIRLIVCPDLMAGLPLDGSLDEDGKKRIIAVQKAMDAQCQRLKYRFAILDTPPGLNAQQVKTWRSDLGIDSSYAALYYPWLEVADLSGANGRTKFIPPSGIMAGVYNRVDGSRGVHKAPANEVPLGVIGLQYNLTQGEQDTLNPNGINCLRPFPGGRGIKVWGARTLSTEGAWRYINVRRLFINVAASLDAGLQWVVFEPNDRALWARVRRDINAFLSTFWLNGALFGSSKSEAYYVKCDDELNPPAIRDLGQLIIEVGLCPVKPAEFVILRLSQWAGPNAENE